MTINFTDITVVLQGPITQETPLAIESIHKILQGAKTILSTWEGSTLNGINTDQTIFNKDPGNFPFSNEKNPPRMNNANRQLVTTIAGLKAVKTKYAIKMRTDNILIHTKFLDLFKKDFQYNEQFKFLEKRVVLCGIGMSNPKITRVPWYFSDWFYFGLTTDLLKIWDHPLQIESEHKDYFIKYPENQKNHILSHCLSRFATEQYIGSSFVKKYYPILFDHGQDFKKEDIPLMEKSM